MRSQAGAMPDQHSSSRRDARVLARVQRSPWRTAGPILALALIGWMWLAVRAGLLGGSSALALTVLTACAWAIGSRRSGVS